MTATENPTAEPDDEAPKPHSGRTIAVLGEMLELGDEALEAHREVGRMAGQYGIDMLIGVGGNLVKQTACTRVRPAYPTSRSSPTTTPQRPTSAPSSAPATRSS
jgi:hypothetical protein